MYTVGAYSVTLTSRRSKGLLPLAPYKQGFVWQLVFCLEYYQVSIHNCNENPFMDK